MKVLFLVHAPKINASVRYRVYGYLPFLDKVGIKYKVISSRSVPLLRKLTQDIPSWFSQRFHSNEFILRIFRRLMLEVYHVINWVILTPYHLFSVLRSPFYDVVFVQSMIHPGIHNPFLEKLLFKLNPKVVYDTDDALYTMEKIRDKINLLLTKSKYIITSTEALSQHIHKINPKVTVISDPMDFSYYKQKPYNSTTTIVLGWIGHGRNLKSLSLILDTIMQLAKRYDILLKIVSSQDYIINGVAVINKRWRLEDEISDLQSFDIGLNPMFDDEYGRAKNSLKLQQYLAVGLPAVSSPGGLSTDIYRDGENILFARTQEEWLSNITYLIENPGECKRIGANGRATMQNFFSIEKLAQIWLSILRRSKSEERI